MTKRINYEKMQEVFKKYLGENVCFLEKGDYIYIYDEWFIQEKREGNFSDENIIKNCLAGIDKNDENYLIDNIEIGHSMKNYAKGNLILNFLNKHKGDFIFEEKFSYAKCKSFLEEKGFKIDECDYIAYTPFGTQFVKRINDKLNYVVDALNGKREENFYTHEADVIYLFLKSYKDELLED